MKAIMSFVVFTATVAAHAAVYQSSNASCPHKQAGNLLAMGDTNPKPAPKAARPAAPAANAPSTGNSNWSRR